MSELLQEIRAAFEADLQACAKAEDIEALRVKFLGRKQGLVTLAIKKIGSIPQEKKGAFGQAVNKLKQDVANSLEARTEEISEKASQSEVLDVTLPGSRLLAGRRHPISVVRRKIVAIFLELGYRIEDGPQIENDYYNFQALNIPPDHPARDMQDTFYLPHGMLLRTHTSPVQIRVMERQSPPVKIITPGRVYRRDYDITHTPMFSQVEGLVVDEGITFGDLKGTLEYFTKKMFGAETKVRFRPSFFPFTEPSAEVDISCQFCQGSGCRVCKNSGWIEIMGSGMVDPAVLSSVGYDHNKYSGFAFGMGIERQVMLLHSIDDSRLLFENDIRLLNQIGGWL